MEIASYGALVTGAASGLGAATAAELARLGATVAFRLDLPRAVESAAPPDGVRLISADVTSASDVTAAVAEAIAGPTPLRIAVNCAGIGPSQRILGKAGPTTSNSSALS